MALARRDHQRLRSRVFPSDANRFMVADPAAAQTLRPALSAGVAAFKGFVLELPVPYIAEEVPVDG
jgi:hypothetical protein